MDESKTDERRDQATARFADPGSGFIANLPELWRIWRGSILAVSGTVLIMGGYVAADMSGCFEFKYPSGVLDHSISVVGGKPEFDVTIKLEGWNAGSVYNSANEMKDVVKHELKEGKGEQNIVFRVVGDVHNGGGYDSYGNPIPKSTATFNAFNIQYSMDDLRRVNWENMSGSELLNLGTVRRFRAYGDDVARRYCEESIAQTYSQTFCGNF